MAESAAPFLSESGSLETSLFGVDCSLKGQKWLLRPASSELTDILAKQYNLPWPVARLLAARGIDSHDIPSFLQPRLRDSLPNPSRLPDMDKATHCLAEAIRSGETIGVFGDYDVDGQSSLVLMRDYLDEVGARNIGYIPHRLQEGYGPNPAGLDYLANQGARLIVTVDCGAMAHTALHHAASCGLRVIIVDHHHTDDILPPAYAHVNPNRHDQATPGRDLAAVGVVFLLLVALSRVLRLSGYFSCTQPEPDILSKLDLVALGTVADMVPLYGLNRAFVAQGLKIIAKRTRPGLAMLADLAKINTPLRASHLAFQLIPRLNAAGRISHAKISIDLLTTRDVAEAKNHASLLESLNTRRRILDKEIFEQVNAPCNLDRDSPILFAAHEGWHPGVLGIVAYRLVKFYKRPAIVLNLEGNLGTGSGRAPEGFDLGSAILAAHAAGLIETGGGHRAAVGLTVHRYNLKKLHAFLEERILDQIEKTPSCPSLTADAIVAPGALDNRLVRSFDAIEPFGAGHPRPRLALTQTWARQGRLIGQGQQSHVRCRLESEDGVGIEAIAFGVDATDSLGHRLLANDGRPLHVMGELLDSSRKGQASFVIDDIA